MSIEKVYCSVSTYWLGRTVGIDKSREVFARQLQLADEAVRRAIAFGEVAQPDVLPCVHTITGLRSLVDQVQLAHDAGGTVIGKVRSRAFHGALTSDADVWLSVDDDVDASPATLAWLLGAVDDSMPRICVAPCLLRRGDKAIANVELYETGIERHVVPHGINPEVVGATALGSTLGVVRPIKGAGFALVAVNRAALECLRADWDIPEMRYLDDDGVTRIALFHDQLEGGKWWGEDRSFFRRVAASKMVTVEALLTGETAHAGMVLELERVR